MAVAFTPSQEPSVGTGSETTAKALVSRFGDGYEQRAGDGIRPTRETVTLTWTALVQSEMETLKADLESGMGVTARIYTLPGESTARRWVVEKVSRTWSGRLLWDLAAELREVPDL